MYPLAIYPPHLDERMSAQQACFTLFGNIAELVNNDTNEKFLDCVYIDGGSKESIFKELKTLGISNYSVFPDLDGLGKDINYEVSEDLSQVQDENDKNDKFNTFIRKANEDRITNNINFKG